jgi:hypothetical protein
MLTVRAASQQIWMTDVRFGSKADIVGYQRDVSALHPKADIVERDRHVRFVPFPDIATLIRKSKLSLNGARQLMYCCSESCQRDVPKSPHRGSDDARGGRSW